MTVPELYPGKKTKGPVKVLVLSFLSIFAAISCTRTITPESLVEEMASREMLTLFPAPAFSHRQFSSYNRAALSPDKEGWFANADMSHFLRIEMNHGRREFVMLDTDGPGAIVRWWMTFYKAQHGMLRIYIDNDSIPAIAGKPSELLSGNLLAEYPLSASVQEGAPLGEEGRDYDHNLYYPIPFSKHCKVTYECDSLRILYEYEGIPVPRGYYWPDVFYNIGCRLYGEKAKLQSFSMPHSDKLKSLARQAGNTLLSDETSCLKKAVFEKLIPPDDSLVVEINGMSSAINELSVELLASDVHQALRSTVISISFDGMRTVWVPAGEFFGSGYCTQPHKTWMNARNPDGVLRSLWIMPFREKCVITFLNFGKQDIELKGHAGLCRYRWRKESMYFGAAWHEYFNVLSRDSNNHPFDLNFIDITGKGVYVGDQVTLFNSTWQWWGEGDEKIFVDGESFPSSFGTGSEDYYGYSFGRQESFSHPFLSQPAGKGNMASGPVINMRHRSLDAIPFNNAISANIELWHWDSVRINFALTAYFYIFPGYSLNIRPDIESVRRPVILTSDDFISKVRQIK